MQSDFHDKNARDLDRVVQVSAALSLGALAAILYSLKEVNPVIRFEFSVGSVVAFALVASIVWTLAPRVISFAEPSEAELASTRRKGNPWRALVGFVAITVGTIAAVAFSLRNVQIEREADILNGVCMAVFVVAFLAAVMLRLMRFFESSDKDS